MEAVSFDMYIAPSIIHTIHAGVGFGPRLAWKNLHWHNRLPDYVITMATLYQAMTLYYSQEVISTK